MDAKDMRVGSKKIHGAPENLFLEHLSILDMLQARKLLYNVYYDIIYN